jgi:uncharacterized membrane protein
MDLFGRLRGSFVTGLVLVAPLAVTVFVLQFLFTQVTSVLDPVVRTTRLTTLTGNIEFVAQLLAALLIAVGITALGYAASWGFGQRLFGGFERGVRLIPLVRTIYFGVRQVGESLSRRSDRFEDVVLVEFPREGLYSLGFVTNEAPDAVTSRAGDRLLNVFVPNSPNPTAGALVMVPEGQVAELDMSVRRGIRLLVTTGLSSDDINGEVPDPTGSRTTQAAGSDGVASGRTSRTDESA